MTESQVLRVPIDQIVPDLAQPRQAFDAEAIDRMAKSIQARGLLQPIRIRWDAQRGCWLLVSGETRWRGAKQAGLATIPAVPVDGELSETDLLADQLIENVVRESLRPLEFARSLDRLKRLKGCTSKELAAELGISGGSITRAEALLSLPDDIQALIEAGRVSADAGYQISRLDDEAAQRELAHDIAAGRVSRDRATAVVQEAIGKRKSAAKAGRLPLRLASGISVTIAGSQLTWDGLLGSLDAIRKQAELLKKSGKEVSDLPGSLAAQARGELALSTPTGAGR